MRLIYVRHDSRDHSLHGRVIQSVHWEWDVNAIRWKWDDVKARNDELSYHRRWYHRWCDVKYSRFRQCILIVIDSSFTALAPALSIQFVIHVWYSFALPLKVRRKCWIISISFRSAIGCVPSSNVSKIWLSFVYRLK
eukprot:269740_1